MLHSHTHRAFHNPQVLRVRLTNVDIGSRDEGRLGWEVSTSVGKTQVQSVLTSGLMKFVLACLTSHHQGTSSAPCRWEFWPTAMALPQEICLCVSACVCWRELTSETERFSVKGREMCMCDVVCFFPSVLLHVSVSAHHPDLAAVCTLAPVFSRAEEEAAEWWHCLPAGTLAANGGRAFREEGQGRRRTPFSRNRWDMQQDAPGEDVAVTENIPSPSWCTVCLYLELCWMCTHEMRLTVESYSGASTECSRGV